MRKPERQTRISVDHKKIHRGWRSPVIWTNTLQPLQITALPDDLVVDGFVKRSI